MVVQLVWDTAHKWFCSYLTGRTQSVIIDGHQSSPMELGFSVPQRSVLGPKKYCMYCRVIGYIAARFGLKYHCYADDTELYIVIKAKDGWNVTKKAIEDCVQDIYSWMELNLLKMNEDKTEFIVFTPWNSSVKTDHMNLTIGQTAIQSAKVVKNLGTYGTHTYKWKTRSIQSVNRATII